MQSPTTPDHHGLPVIEVRGLGRDYPSAGGLVRAIRDLDLDIRTGEYVSLTGESGAGKSTLLKLLGCLDRATRGDYLLNGRNVSTLSDDDLAEVRNACIGFVFQNSRFVDYLNLTDNVCLADVYARGGTPDQTRAVDILRQVGLGHRLHHKPRQLSGGEQQRAAIARALYKQPALVLADEPTGNLDRTNSERVTALFDEISAQGYTLLVVTHDPDVASKATRHCRLENGVVVG